MYEPRFGEKPSERRSVEQLCGIEGAWVKKAYGNMAKRYGVKWQGRRYDPTQWDASDTPNLCLSAATAYQYGITEAAILASASSTPAKPLSFVYDIADIVKFNTVVPVASRIAAKEPPGAERKVRLACRDVFRKTKLLGKIIPMIEDVLSAGQLEPPQPPKEAVPPAIKDTGRFGDVSHRHCKRTAAPARSARDLAAGNPRRRLHRQSVQAVTRIHLDPS